MWSWRNLRVSCRALSPQVTEPIFTSVATCLAISFEGIAATVGCGGDSSLMANANSELSPNEAREKNTLSHKICHFLRRETGLLHSSSVLCGQVCCASVRQLRR